MAQITSNYRGGPKQKLNLCKIAAEKNDSQIFFKIRANWDNRIVGRPPTYDKFYTLLELTREEAFHLSINLLEWLAANDTKIIRSNTK